MTAKRMRTDSFPVYAFVNTTPLPLFNISTRSSLNRLITPLTASTPRKCQSISMTKGNRSPKMAAVLASILLLLSNPVPSFPLSDAQRLVAEAWRIVDNAYVDRTFNNLDWFSIRMKAVKRKYPSVNDAYIAIRDMLALLADPYTRFLTPQQYASLTSTATGELAGVGVEMFPARVDNVLKVASPLDGSPAARAGIRSHDVIEFIDGESTDGLTPDEAAARIRGRPGTAVNLTVIHEAKSGKPVEETVQLTREALKLQTVAVTQLKNDTVLVRIKQFNSTTAEDLDNALSSLVSIKRIILDLRNNPGGYFPGGVDVARLFFKAETPIVYVVDKNGIEIETDSIKDGQFRDVPLVVLVNGATASASEILAGALKDNHRASLVGEKTFGKGVVQTVSQLSDGSGLAVTVARYETPGHKNINKIGILPDFSTPCSLDADVLQCIPSDAW